jgi:FlaG/FlaF family flagellin (archaellin)
MNDRDVYLKLAAVAEELFGLSNQAETLVGQTALRTAAGTIAGTAKAIYDHALGGEEH